MPGRQTLAANRLVLPSFQSCLDEQGRTATTVIVKHGAEEENYSPVHPVHAEVSHVSTTLRLKANPSRREPQRSRLPIQRILTLLLVVLGKRALALSDSSLVDLNTGMSVFEHHTALRRAFFTVFGEFGLLRALDGEWTVGSELTSNTGLIG